MVLPGSDTWRYVSIIFQAIFSRYIPWNLGLIEGSYLQSIGSWDSHWNHHHGKSSGKKATNRGDVVIFFTRTAWYCHLDLHLLHLQAYIDVALANIDMTHSQISKQHPLQKIPIFTQQIQGCSKHPRYAWGLNGRNWEVKWPIYPLVAIISL